jgi:hypothetical protein
MSKGRKAAGEVLEGKLLYEILDANAKVRILLFG